MRNYLKKRRLKNQVSSKKIYKKEMDIKETSDNKEISENVKLDLDDDIDIAQFAVFKKYVHYSCYLMIIYIAKYIKCKIDICRVYLM